MTELGRATLVSSLGLDSCRHHDESTAFPTCLGFHVAHHGGRDQETLRLPDEGIGSGTVALARMPDIGLVTIVGSGAGRARSTSEDSQSVSL